MGGKSEVFYYCIDKLCVITDLIHIIMNESENLMKGSVHRDDFFIVHDDLVLLTAKETINWIGKNSYLHIWLLPLNGMQDGNPYDGRPVGNIPKFILPDNSFNRGILHSLRMHSVLSRYMLGGEETDEEERNMCFNYSSTREIS